MGKREEEKGGGVGMMAQNWDKYLKGDGNASGGVCGATRCDVPTTSYWARTLSLGASP